MNLLQKEIYDKKFKSKKRLVISYCKWRLDFLKSKPQNDLVKSYNPFSGIYRRYCFASAKKSDIVDQASWRFNLSPLEIIQIINKEIL